MVDTHLDRQAASDKKLVKSDQAKEFFCFRCQERKVSKTSAKWTTTEGEKTICNGCYGYLTSLARK